MFFLVPTGNFLHLSLANCLSSFCSALPRVLLSFLPLPSGSCRKQSDLRPALLQAEQTQISLPLLILLVLQPLNPYCWPLLDLLQSVNVIFVLGSPKLDPEFQKHSQKGQRKGNYYFP